MSINADQLIEEIDGFLWPEDDLRQRRTRERLLAAATDLFGRYGYRKTSVDEVARNAGVAKGTVYLYYRNKAELLYHVLAQEKRAHLNRLDFLSDPALSPRDRLRSLIALAVIVSRQMPVTNRMMQGDHELELAFRDVDEQVLADVNARQMRFTLHLLNEATNGELPETELNQRGEVLINLLLAGALSSLMNAGGMPLTNYASQVAALIVDGICRSEDVVIASTLLTESQPAETGGAQP